MPSFGQSPSPCLQLTSQLADIFASCCVHFKSQRLQDRSLYRKLQEANVYESDEISTTMTISRHRSSYIVRGVRSNVHIDSDEEQLRLYVPKDKKERKLCYLNQLPQKLAIHLGLADSSAIRIMGSIMSASSDLLDDLLMEEDIVRVRGVEGSHFEASANGSDKELSRCFFTKREDTQVAPGS